MEPSDQSSPAANAGSASPDASIDSNNSINSGLPQAAPPSQPFAQPPAAPAFQPSQVSTEPQVDQFGQVSQAPPLPSDEVTPQQPSPITVMLTTPQPPAPSPTVVSPEQPAAVTPLPPPKKKHKKFALLLLALLVLAIGGSAAAYVGVIMPNKPENIWSTALSRTAAGYDGLVAYNQQNQNLNGGKINGTFNVKAAGLVADGTIEGKYYDKDADFNLSLGAAGQRFNIETLLHTPVSATNPDIYIKATGLTGLGSLLGGSDPSIAAMLKSYDNQWFFIDHTLLDQATQTVTKTSNAASANLTSQDVTTIEQKFGQVNRQYLLTTKSDTAVLTEASNVGKETVDNRPTYHYKIGYNKEHLKAYVTALKDAAKQTKINDYFKDKSLEDSINFTQMLKDIDTLDGKGTADVWVDTGTKLVHKVRFTDQTKKQDYFDIVLNYTGGNDYPFAFIAHTVDTGITTDGNLKINLNTKSNNLTFDFALTSTDISSTNNNTTANFHLAVVRGNDKVPFTAPAGAKSLGDLLGGIGTQLGGGSLGPSASGVSKILEPLHFN